MDNNPNPLTYHYESRLKLDHFLLGADIALLGWTIVNLNWLPTNIWFELGILAFWVLIIISLCFGILRQIYSSQAFGLNFLMVDAGERANMIERSTINGGIFIDQQTKESMSAEEFKKFGDTQRNNQKIFKDEYDKLNNRTAWLGNWSLYCLVAGLCILAALRLFVFSYPIK